MGDIFHVKSRILLTVAALSCGLALARAAEGDPDPLEILKTVRTAQNAQHMILDGRLRTGPTSIPLRLLIEGSTVRYEFKDPALAIVLRLGDKGSQLQEITHGATEKVTPARFDQKVRDTDISYEDLSMRFLYWPKATLEGEESKLTRRCWKLQVQPGNDESQYSKVDLWIDQGNGAMLQAEAYDKSGKLARRFTVRSGQKVDDAWILKQMRIEAFANKPGVKDPPPTYMEITGTEK